MRPPLYLPLAALLVLIAPRIATPQASQTCCQVNPPATAKPTQPGFTVRGSDKAPITILVFSDFESFPCARSASVIDGLLQQTRDVHVIFQHAPAASNPNALLAHEAALWRLGRRVSSGRCTTLSSRIRPILPAPTYTATPSKSASTYTRSSACSITTPTAPSASATWPKPRPSASPLRRRCSSTAAERKPGDGGERRRHVVHAR